MTSGQASVDESRVSNSVSIVHHYRIYKTPGGHRVADSLQVFTFSDDE
jgi:hypothetical protein